MHAKRPVAGTISFVEVMILSWRVVMVISIGLSIGLVLDYGGVHQCSNS